MKHSQQDFLDAAGALALTDAELDQVLVSQRGAELVRLARALTSMFPIERAAAWVRAPREAFGGRAAIDLLLSDDLDEAGQARQYAEYWAYNGW